MNHLKIELSLTHTHRLGNLFHTASKNMIPKFDKNKKFKSNPSSLEHVLHHILMGIM